MQMSIIFSNYSVVPGPVTNYNIYNQNGWKLEWTPPDNSTGLLNIHYYEIEWTINNEFHSKNISFEKNYFEVNLVKLTFE